MSKKKKSGWIKFHRSVLECPISEHPEYFSVWGHLLLRAQYSQTKTVIGRQVISLNPGQLVFGRIKFSEDTGVSESKVRSALDILKALGMITIKNNAKFSVISIANWSEYQDESPEDDLETSSTSPASDQHLASSSPAVDHIQEGEESKEGKEREESKEKNNSDLPEAQDSAKPKKPNIDNFEPKTLVQFMLPELEQAWLTWIDYRKQRKFKTVEKTWMTQAKKLADWGKAGHDPVKIIEQSIGNGWQGLFEPDFKQSFNGKQQPESAATLKFTAEDYSAGINPDGSF